MFKYLILPMNVFIHKKLTTYIYLLNIIVLISPPSCYNTFVSII